MRRRDDLAALLDVDEKLVVLDHDLVGRERSGRRRIKIPTGTNIEAAAVARALDLAAVDLAALTQEASGMRTSIRGREHLAIDLIQSDRIAVDVDWGYGTWNSKLPASRPFEHLWHVLIEGWYYDI
jgi:hypothetical protein